jgi:hypothetical protein
MTRYGELEIALRTPSDTALNWLTHAPPGAVTGLASRAKTASLWPSSWHRRPHDLDVDVATSESSASSTTGTRRRRGFGQGFPGSQRASCAVSSRQGARGQCHAD